MFSRTIKAGTPAVVAAGLACGLLAPSGALAHGASASVSASVDLHAASVQLATFERFVHTRARVATHALHATLADTAAASRQIRVAAAAGPLIEAEVSAQVAAQDGAEVHGFIGLLPGVRGRMRVVLASSLAPSLSSERQAITALASVGGELPPAAAAGSVSLMGQLLGQDTGEIATLDAMVATGSAGNPTPAGAQIALALSGDTATVDASLTELESLVPELPSADQPFAAHVLVSLGQQLVQADTGLNATTSADAGALGVTVAARLGDLGDLLHKLVALLPTIAASVGTTDPATTTLTLTGTTGGSTDGGADGGSTGATTTVTVSGIGAFPVPFGS